MFIVRTLIATSLVAAALIPSPTQAANTPATKTSIRSMPITERPSRPGHFYGNTVRRVHQRRSG
jgi:hypothetical protein